MHLKVRSKFQKDGRKSRANVRYAASRYKDTPVTSLTPYVTQFGAFSHIHNVHRKLAIAVPSLQCAQEIRAAHIAAGDRIVATTAGKGTTTTTDKKSIVGMALQAGTTSGDICEVLLTPGVTTSL